MYNYFYYNVRKTLEHMYKCPSPSSSSFISFLNWALSKICPQCSVLISVAVKPPLLKKLEDTHSSVQFVLKAGWVGLTFVWWSYNVYFHSVSVYWVSLSLFRCCNKISQPEYLVNKGSLILSSGGWEAHHQDVSTVGWGSPSPLPAYHCILMWPQGQRSAGPFYRQFVMKTLPLWPESPSKGSAS